MYKSLCVEATANKSRLNETQIAPIPRNHRAPPRSPQHLHSCLISAPAANSPSSPEHSHSLISRVIAGANVKFGPDPLHREKWREPRTAGVRTELGLAPDHRFLAAAWRAPCCAPVLLLLLLPLILRVYQSFSGLFPLWNACQLRGKFKVCFFHSCYIESQIYFLLHAVFFLSCHHFSPPICISVLFEFSKKYILSYRLQNCFLSELFGMLYAGW